MVTVDSLTTSYHGKSSDTKPTEGRNGDIFTEIDTGLVYVFDEENGEWLQFPPAVEEKKENEEK